jgi:outer membrane lipoprotein SlyB
MEDLTVEEVLKLVTFKRDEDGTLYVVGVWGSVWGSVKGNVCGNVCGVVGGDIGGNVGGHVFGNVCGSVGGKINGRQWQFVETPKEKAIRLIREGNGEEAIKVLQEGE